MPNGRTLAGTASARYRLQPIEDKTGLSLPFE